MRNWWVLAMIFGVPLQAAPQMYRPAPTGYAAQNSVSDLRHEVSNHEAEIRMFEERLNTQEVIVDSLRQQLLDVNDENRELVKKSSVSMEGSLSHLEASVKGITDDVKTLQAHGNDTSKVLSQHKKKMEELEHKLDQLQETLQLVLDALQVSPKESIASQGEQVYEVKSGDSLEKIARLHKTSIRKIKELNQLKSDRIYIGQKLKLP
jgi:LysM repeat protein